jgi:hypothetical protein
MGDYPKGAVLDLERAISLQPSAEARRLLAEAKVRRRAEEERED